MLNIPHFPAMTMFLSSRGNTFQPFCSKQIKQTGNTQLPCSQSFAIHVTTSYVYFGTELFKKTASSKVQVSLMQAAWALSISLPTSTFMVGKRAGAKGGLKQECVHSISFFQLLTLLQLRATFHSPEKWFMNIPSVVTVWNSLTVGAGHAGAGIFCTLYTNNSKCQIPSAIWGKLTPGSVCLKKPKEFHAVRQFPAAFRKLGGINTT